MRHDIETYPYASATALHLSPSPPTTMTVLSLYWSISANGVWLCTNMLVSISTPNFLLRSLTRSDSCFPPPFVNRINGMRCDWRYDRAFGARGSGSELRTRTPSILTAVSGGRRQGGGAGHSTRMRKQIQGLWQPTRRFVAYGVAVGGGCSIEAVSMLVGGLTFWCRHF